MNLICCPDLKTTVQFITNDPRYLAHSAREIATFTLTYFPPVLAFIFWHKKEESTQVSTSAKLTIACLSLITFCMLAWQTYLPLYVGVGKLAQQPDFAQGSPLPIPYLLASHYFEHFLDSIFFFLSSIYFTKIST